MRYSKTVKYAGISIILLASSLTLYVAINNMNFFGSQSIQQQKLEKVYFEKNEWHNFVDDKGKINQLKFREIFIRKLAIIAKPTKIKFEFESTKAVVLFEYDSRQYKWFYKVVNNFNDII